MGDASADNLAHAAERDDAPKVSCVIIFLNPGAAFFREAVESVLAQTLRNWELFLCDDGSTDETTAIAKEYAARHPERVRYLDHPGHANRGMSATRNLGLRHATGDFVSFLDADDAWTPGKLREQAAILQNRPDAAVVFGPLLLWRSWTGKREDRGQDVLQPVGVPADSLVAPGALVTAYLRDEKVIPSGMMFRRGLLEAVGGYDDAFTGMYEDLVVTTKLLLRHPAYASGTCWYHYRQHAASCSTSAIKAKQHEAARGRFLRWMEAHLAETNLGDTAVRAALDEELAPFRRPLRTWLSRLPGRAVRFLDRHGTNLTKRLVGPAGRRWLRDRLERKPLTPPPGWVRFGSLRRTTPLSRGFGWNRGEPIDRHYVESFLKSHAGDIKGRVLEIGDASYTVAFGGDRVTRSDVLHAVEGNPAATIVGDLESGRNVPDGAFDCVILTQTVHCLYDVKAALTTAHRSLAPGGVLLVTLPGISQVSRYDMDRWGDYWRFTSRSAQRLFADVFGGEASVTVQPYGNVLAAVGLLHGIDRRELKPRELDEADPDYEVTIGVRAVRDRHLHSLPRYPGGGLGRGSLSDNAPVANERHGEPPPLPSPGVPGEGVREGPLRPETAR